MKERTPRPLFRLLPQVDRLLRHPSLGGHQKTHPREIIGDAIREALTETRQGIADGSLVNVLTEDKDRILDYLISRIREKLARRGRPSLCRVINATGVIIHTNLGRSPLAREALEAIAGIGRRYSNLEYSLSTGERDDRLSHVVGILTRLTGAEGALVVNNNAAAVLLALNTMAQGKEVIVSRGELVEIGGSFRIPEVMEKSGAVLVEVGTTNKTRLEDYARAISERTALLLKVHKSNFEVRGFTEEVSVKELSHLSHSAGLPVMMDLGSGNIFDRGHLGRGREPSVKETLAAGADIVTFSGDKLFGGPQAGIILGGKAPCRRAHGNPLYRALRPDKFTLAALEATARIYLSPDTVVEHIPVLKMVSEPVASISRRARALTRALTPPSGWTIAIVEEESAVGGGALPLVSLPTRSVALSSRTLSSDEVAVRLRACNPPIICRISEGRALLDMRTVDSKEVGEIARELTSVMSQTERL